MKLQTATNLLSNAVKGGMLREMVRKVLLRVREREDPSAMEAWHAKLAATAIDADKWASSFSSVLWAEAVEFGEAQTRYAEDRLRSVPVSLGGGGFYHLLYFLTRLMQPKVVLETGVAAGFSSRAFLTALKANGSGRLFSSDFPYFRLENPEKYIGILVEDELRSGWTLMIEGDRVNLPKISAVAGSIDIFHYDSDKSASGRNFAFETLSRNFTDDTIYIFDDIQDNLHFEDLRKKLGRESMVFAFKGKYVGLIMPVRQPEWAKNTADFRN